MEDKRTEFAKLRKQWMKDHEWKGFVCARCGRYSTSVHLHHIQELIHGGENAPENLIPLCGDCHRELDVYPEGWEFEKFLVTLPGLALPITQKAGLLDGAEYFTTRGWLGFCASAYRAVNMAKAGNKLEEQEWTASDLQYAQNQFFSKYPYSDESWRAEQLKSVYGEITPTRV